MRLLSFALVSCLFATAACEGGDAAPTGGERADEGAAQLWDCELLTPSDDQSLVTRFEIMVQGSVDEEGVFTAKFATGEITPAPDGDPIELALKKPIQVGKMTTVFDARADFINVDEGVDEELAIVLFESSVPQASIAYTLDDFAGRAVESYQCEVEAVVE